MKSMLMEKKQEIFNLQKKSPGEVNIVWVEIDQKYRGKGYSQSVLEEIIKFAKSSGYKKMTLEVPGISPNARHIYEKLGF